MPDDLQKSMDESWRKVWRQGVVPHLNLEGLLALEQALVTNDRRLIQGATISPPPLQCVQGWPVDAACLIAYCGWHGNHLHTVGDLELFFADICRECDDSTGEPGSVRWLLTMYDEWPRETMIANLLPEVRLAIELRKANVPTGSLVG